MDNTKTFKTDNELIAEFMGWLYLGKSTSGLNMWSTTNNKYLSDTLGELFDKSWDWLMPVVEKITPIALKMGQQAWMDAAYLLIHGNLSASHKAVVEFIKWYNQTKQP